MGGRNNKFCKGVKGQQQIKGSRPKRGSGRQRNPPKEILPLVKRTISMYMAGKKTNQKKTILNYKFKLLLNFEIGMSSVIIAGPIVDNWLLVFIWAT